MWFLQTVMKLIWSLKFILIMFDGAPFAVYSGLSDDDSCNLVDGIHCLKSIRSILSNFSQFIAVLRLLFGGGIGWMKVTDRGRDMYIINVLMFNLLRLKGRRLLYISLFNL